MKFKMVSCHQIRDKATKKPLINWKDRLKRACQVLFSLVCFRVMNKILEVFKRRILCINGQTDHEMVNLSQFSPRVTRSKSKKQEKPEVKCQQKKAVDELQKKTLSVGRPKGKKKNERKTGELNSVKANRGSVGTISLLNTPKTLDSFSLKVLSPNHLNVTEAQASAKSPPIRTVSADTPERSSRFYRNIENVTECKLRVLGKGSFGTIIQATYKGELVAAKIVPPNKTNSLKNELNNFLLLHPNIIKTLRIISNEENSSCGLVIMEMYSSFTLENLSNEESYNLNEKSIVRFMTDVGNALDYCHRQRVLHLDVKPQNILVNVTTNVCKLCDFGSSRLLSGEEMPVDDSDHKILQSTLVYTSPELLTGKSPTDKSDVYSFGITLWQLVHREKPYVVDSKIDLQSTIYKIIKQRKRPQKKIKPEGALEKLYMMCWEHEPEKRPAMKEVIQFLENIHLS